MFIEFFCKNKQNKKKLGLESGTLFSDPSAEVKDKQVLQIFIKSVLLRNNAMPILTTFLTV